MGSSDQHPTGGGPGGAVLAARRQRDFELEFFGRVLARNPSHVDALRQQVELLVETGAYDKALELDQRLARLAPQDGVVRYNLACTLAMTGQLVQAIDTLAQAIALGYHDFAHMEADPDLDVLRDLPAYRALLALRNVAR